MSTLKNMPIAGLKRRFELRSFVETGTFEGDGLRFALSLGFERCFSCDIVEKWAHAAEREHASAGRDNVYVFHSDSLSFLRTLPNGIGPSLFWLDAHQPAIYGGHETRENKFPVLAELDIIRQRSDAGRDVVIVDDLIVIEGSPRWHKGEVCEELQVRDVSWETLFHFLDGTHDAEYCDGMEGYLVFTPKGGSERDLIDEKSPVHS